MISKYNSRTPAVAGMFYPSEPQELSRYIDKLLSNFQPSVNNNQRSEKNIKAIIAPHAGYVFSGACAAKSYFQIPKNTKTVFLLGPSHHVGFSGIALPSVEAFSTPLGDIQLNSEIIKRLIERFRHIKINDQAHLQEHSLEVHLPFLQKHLTNFTIVPMVVGQSSKDDICDTLEYLHKKSFDNSFYIISSDLSHFHSYPQATQIDQQTINKILNLDNNINGDEACGCYPLNGWLMFAKKHNLTPLLINNYNSGDVEEYGDRSRVVGYAAFSFFEPNTNQADSDDNQNLGNILLEIARNSIHNRIKKQSNTINLNQYPSKIQNQLKSNAAVFVTITKNNNLRGCIGSLIAYRPLINDTIDNAIAAAFRDPRFSPLSETEMEEIKLEVSLLTPPIELSFQTREQGLAKLRPGIDGVIFSEGINRSTFLPQVWEQLPNTEEFIDHLIQKAGLPSGYWSDNVKLETYQVRKWSE